MPAPDFFSAATLPSGADLYASASAKLAATQASTVESQTLPTVAPEADAETLVAPYRERKGITFDLYADPKGPAQRATVDTLLDARGKLDAQGKPFDDYTLTVLDADQNRKGIALRDLNGALSQGYTLEGSHEAATHRFIEDNKGLKGDALVALRNYSDELFLGIPGLIDAHADSPEQIDQNAKLDALAKEHSLANALGGAAGFGASLLVGGPLFKGAALAGEAVERATVGALTSRLAQAGVESGAKSLAQRIVTHALGTGARIGTEAGIIAAPKAITEAALGDPDAAAEGLVWNVGAGAALGMLGGGAKELFGNAAKQVFQGASTVPGKLEAYANTRAVKSLDLLQKFTGRLSEMPGGEEAAGKVVREYGLVRGAGSGVQGENFRDLNARVLAAKQSVGEQIGAHYAELDKYGGIADAKEVAVDLRRQVLKPLEESVGFEAKAAKVRRYIDSFVEKTGASPPEAPDLLPLPSRPVQEGVKAFEDVDVAGRAQAHAEALAAHEDHVHLTNWVNNDRLARFEAAKARPAELKASDLLNIRRDLDDLIYGEKLPAPDQVDKSYKAIRGIIKGALDSKASELQGTEYMSRLDKLNRDYGTLSIIQKGTQKNVARVMSNRTSSLTDYIAGGAGQAVGAIAGGAIGGPVGAIVGGGAAKLVGMLGNKYMRENYNRLAVTGADKLGLLFAEQSVRKTAHELDRIPDILGRLTNGPSMRGALDTTPVRGLGVLTDHDGTRAERYQHAVERLEAARKNISDTADKVAVISGGLAEGGAPEIARAYTLKQQKALDYLYQTMPRQQGMPPLFGSKKPWAPSQRDMLAWERRAEIVENPFRALHHLARGTLTKDHVEALQAVYPALAAKIGERVQAHAADPKAPVLPAQVQAQLGTLLGGSGPEAASVRRLQKNFTVVSEQEKISGPASMGGQPGPALDKVPDLGTPTQRISQR